MIKQVQFAAFDRFGDIRIQPLIGLGLEKTASIETRSKLHPRIQDFVRSVRPTPEGIYVLVNALGAGEFWGSNVNGDLFPEAALVHAPEQWDKLPITQQRQVAETWNYGFPTFLNAHPYTHHINKDPTRAFGSVELATWNPEMHRVELICYLDRARAELFGATAVIERIDRGEFPDVSMGCRVPFDVCTICEKRSKTNKDYCIHARSWMNMILPDGRKVAVRNDYPRFFDISFVFIGADKTAKVMAKLAQQGSQFCLGSFCTIPRLSADVGAVFSKEAGLLTSPLQTPAFDRLAQVFIGQGKKQPKVKVDSAREQDISPDRNMESTKLASACSAETSCACGCVQGEAVKLASAFLAPEKIAFHNKISELLKEVPAGPFTEETLPKLEKSEKTLPKELLNQLGSKNLGSALSTTGLLGMVLKPREFQRILLVRMGEGDLADQLDDKNTVFPSSQEKGFSPILHQGLMDEDLKKLLMLFLGERSSAAPALQQRVQSASKKPAQAAEEPTTSSDPLMKKIAAAYNGYRHMLVKQAEAISDYMVSDPQVRSRLYGSGLAEAFSGAAKTANASVLGPESLAYLAGAFIPRSGMTAEVTA